MLNPAQQQLLERILAAVKWAKQDCKLFVLQGSTPQNFAEKLQQYQSTQVIVFGFEMAQTLQLAGIDKVAVVHTLDELMQDQQKKKKSWEILQSVIARP
jgi:hypothetical protein